MLSDVHHLCKSPSGTTKPAAEDALLCQFGHKEGFRAQPVSRGAGADTTLLSFGSETEVKLGHHWCCPCPKARIPTAQGRQGRKEIPLFPFYRGGFSAGFSGLSDLRVTSRSPARGGGCLAQGLTPGWVQGAEHSSAQHRPKLHSEIHQQLLLINRHIEKNLVMSVGESKGEDKAKSNKSSTHSFCSLSSCS